MEDYWFLPNIGDILFDTTANPAEYVYVEFYDPREGKIRFERDLTQNEAPGPKDHWPTCSDEQATSGNDGITSTSEWVAAYCTVLLFFSVNG